MKKQWILAGILSFWQSGLALAQNSLSQLEEQLFLAETLVEELEDSHDQMNLTLAEPLAQLAEQYTYRGRYAEAHRVLDRATQIVRVNEGLYTRSQLPYVRQKIENFAAARDWESARQQLQHIFWLYRKKSKVADQQLIEDLLHLSKMHLRGVNEDLLSTQSYHFRVAMSVNWMALAVGEFLYGREDERLVPTIYNLLHQHHLQKVAVDRGGTLGYQLRQVFPGSDWVRERNEIRNYFYFTGRRLLNQIAGIYGKAGERNDEAIAMTRLYTADWQVLFGRDADALESYQQAYNALKIIQPEKVDDFFAQPKVLPIPQFHASIESALTPDAQKEPAVAIETPSSRTLSFTEWGSAFPYVRQPFQDPVYAGIDTNRALISFNLAGVADVPMWVNTRNAQKFSVAVDPQLLDSEADSSAEQDLITQRVAWLTFRPKLVNGLPQDAAATLEYWALQEF
ncbi:MAG: hypothetical protein GKR91_20160 [Pseudomonadales bacterium]|nr:hypothetical protein [Pseudomonadales bacterium]